MKLPNLKRVDTNVLKRYLARFGLDVHLAENNVEQAVKAVSEKMKAAKSLARCDTCGGDSDTELPECPYCGDSESDTGDTESTPAEVVDVDASDDESQDGVVDEDEDDEDVDEDEDDEDVDEDEDDEDVDEDDEEIEVESDEAQEEEVVKPVEPETAKKRGRPAATKPATKESKPAPEPVVTKKRGRPAATKPAAEPMLDPVPGKKRGRPAKAKGKKEKPTTVGKSEMVVKKRGRPAGSKPATETVSTAVEVVKKEKAPTVTSTELENGIATIHQLQIKGIECMWDLGNALLDVYAKKLYTQMKRGGVPVYDSWTKFCRKELNMDPRYGFKLMDVSSHFTKEQVASVGVTKLQMLVRVPEEQRAELLEQASNTPRSALAKQVAKLAGGKVRDTGRNDKFKGTRGNGPKVDKSSKITVIRSEPRVVVDFYKRGTTERISIDDIDVGMNAVGIEKCANGVTINYMLVATDAGLSLAIETRRDE